MRKVAALCGRNLNNVQYYYKNKAALLSGLANYYFERCAGLFDEYAPSPEDLPLKEKLQEAIFYALQYSSQLSDECIVFRELWALSTRNEEIEEQLKMFYMESVEKMCQILGEYNPAQSKIAASILLPYLDGYSIQHKSLPVTIEQLSNALTECMFTLFLSSSEE